MKLLILHSLQPRHLSFFLTPFMGDAHQNQPPRSIQEGNNPPKWSTQDLFIGELAKILL